MICCLTLAALLGLLLRPLAALRPSPLTWRPGDAARVPSASWSASRLKSFTHAFAGLRFLMRNEPNMRIHFAVAAFVLVAGLWLGINLAGWRWLVAAMALVPIAEALNTGVEQACNAISREHRPEIKAAKDVAAAGVLIAALASALIGASVFVPALLDRPSPHAVLLCGGKEF
jgi:diacylglycerol kinase